MKGGGRVPQKGVARFVGVFAVVVGAAGADVGAGVAMHPTGGRAAKNPERVVGAVLAGENVEVQLRLALLEGNKKRRERGDHHSR